MILVNCLFITVSLFNKKVRLLSIIELQLLLSLFYRQFLEPLEINGQRSNSQGQVSLRKYAIITYDVERFKIDDRSNLFSSHTFNLLFRRSFTSNVNSFSRALVSSIPRTMSSLTGFTCTAPL